jgi:hypothetical protein
MPLRLGIQMQVSMEVLLMELGLSAQPLQESFTTHGKRVTDTWLKSVWEKVDRFNIKVEIARSQSAHPGRETNGS